GVDRNMVSKSSTDHDERSPPTRRRGSKRDGRMAHGEVGEVASHAEAWIETWMFDQRTMKPSSSPPTRRRGSKQYWFAADYGARSRLPRGGVDRNSLLDKVST